MPVLLVACTALFYIAGAQAVHDWGVFELDGNAITANGGTYESTPPAREDWDLICNTNRVQIGTLTSAITTTSATSITVTETTAPKLEPINIQIDSEQMTVTVRTATATASQFTYTVTRGINGSTKATHAANAAIFSGCLFNPGYTFQSGAPSSSVANPSNFTVDPSSVTSDDILKGGTKDDNDITSWKWTSAGSLDKDDLTDGGAAEYKCSDASATCPANHGDDKLLYFFADRYGISGSANVAFWFFQKNVIQQANQPDGECTISAGCAFVDKQGNPVTHKVGDVSLGCGKITPNKCTPGDILVISAFGPHSSINVYEWVGAGNATKDYLGTNSCFTAACSLQPLYVGGKECGNGSGQSGQDDPACAVANTTVTPSPWILPQKNIQGKAVNNQFNADAVKGYSTLFEGGINLTNLGLGGACFSSYLVNSRSSAAGDSELHDKLVGSFQRCAPNLTTQQSVAAVNGAPGTVQPGTAVTDRATVQVTGAASPDDPEGSVKFFLCGPSANSVPNCDGTPGNVGTQVGSSAVTLTDGACIPVSNSDTDGKQCAVSVTVNDSAQPGVPRGSLGNGYYCFRAEATLTNYDNPAAYSDGLNECFQVLKLNTSLLTDPQTCNSANPPVCVTNTGPFALADNTQVYDHAVVTGSAGGGFPEGTVDFFICNPSQVTGAAGSEICPSSAGTQVGTSVTLTHVANETIKSEATSNAAVTANQLGVWCFRAVYTSTSPVYNGTSGGGHEECFTVNTTSSGTSNQKWLPNDRVVVSTPTGSLPGKLEIKLYQGTLGTTCAGSTGTLKYTEPVPSDGAFTATAAGAAYTTTNSTFTVNITPNNNTGDYFWRIVFTPGTFSGGDPNVFTPNPNATGFTKCEKSSVTIDDNPSFP